MWHSDPSTMGFQSASVSAHRLQRTTLLRAASANAGVGVETLLGLAVELSNAVEVGQVLDAASSSTCCDQHPELRAPVADVVLPDHARGPELERRLSASPMVERRWPTCISLATLGAE